MIRRIFIYLNHIPDRIRSAATRLPQAHDGVAAVEFALLVPIFIFVYLMSFQLTVGFSISNNASRAASTISDIVTQQATTNKADLVDMYSLASAIMAPYSTAGLNIKVTGLTLDASGTATVAWSWQKDGTAPYQVASTQTVPTDLQQPNSFLVHAEVATNYNLLFFAPFMTSSTATTVNIKREFYFRQRIGTGVTCSDCPT